MRRARTAGLGRELRDTVALFRGPAPSPEGLPAGDGQAVVLVPGLGASDRSMTVLGGALGRLGYDATGAGIGHNVRCGEPATAQLLARIEALHREHGRRIALVAHSRGGHLARVAALRRPDLVSGVVTLATPEDRLNAVHPAVRVLAFGMGAAGSAGVPGLYKLSCFDRAPCCEGYRRDLHAPFPQDVGFVAIWSRDDVLVYANRISERDARRVEVSAGHVGMLCTPAALDAVAHALVTFGD